MKKMEQDSKSEQRSDFLGTAKFLDIVVSDLKMKILLNLLISKEISLTKIAKKLNKSKPTIHRHLKKLIKNNFVEVSKEKKVRGSIKAKYYKLSKEFQKNIKPYQRSILSKIDNIGSGDEDLEDLIRLLRFYILIILKPLKILKQILNSKDKDTFGRNYNLKEVLKNLEPSFEVMFFSEKQYNEVKELMNDFYSKLKYLRHNQEKNIEKPYYLSLFTLELKKLLELEKRTS
jgi:predicted transcriptional regulator